MKRVKLLLLCWSTISVAYLLPLGSREILRVARETGQFPQLDQTGWTPKPTSAPGIPSSGTPGLPGQETSPWVNSITCGWFSNISSSALTCSNSYSCSKYKSRIACISGGVYPWVADCIDYAGWIASGCYGISGDGRCCTDSDVPFCATYVWPGTPVVSMVDCAKTAWNTWPMLDVPQFVLDASLSSESEKSSMLIIEATTAAVSITETATGISPSSTFADDDDNDNDKNDGHHHHENDDDHTSNYKDSRSMNKMSVIAASVVGALLGIVLLLLLFYFRRKITARFMIDADKMINADPPIRTRSSDNSSEAFECSKPELDTAPTWAELEGTPGEERDSGSLHGGKPELEGTPGIGGLRGIYVRMKSELEAHGRTTRHPASSTPSEHYGRIQRNTSGTGSRTLGVAELAG